MGSVFRRNPARRVEGSSVPESPSGPSATVTLETTIALADALVGMLEYQHPFFRGGSSLVRLVAGALGRELGLASDDQQALALAALLRDLGRIRLGGEHTERPRAELNAVDLRRIEAHVEVGLDRLEEIGLPPAIRDAIRHHHERWDGQGYPDGLSEAEIPLLARILGVADAFVAMIQPRVYRPSRRVAAVLKELRQEAGRRYDPVIVDAAERVLAGPPSRGLGFGLGQHVLVIHPDEDRGTVLSTRLCSKGYLAEVALSGHAARHHMERARVGVVLLASEPGDMSAASFVSDLRADPRFESVRIRFFLS
jgi:putative nucleotidyltransferase with HDIG domain